MVQFEKTFVHRNRTKKRERTLHTNYCYVANSRAISELKQSLIHRKGDNFESFLNLGNRLYLSLPRHHYNVFDMALYKHSPLAFSKFPKQMLASQFFCYCKALQYMISKYLSPIYHVYNSI